MHYLRLPDGSPSANYKGRRILRSKETNPFQFQLVQSTSIDRILFIISKIS